MELLVASIMIAILIVGLSAHLRGGVRVWRRATATSERLQRQRIALDVLERDLVNGFIYESGESPQFPEISLDAGPLQWYTVLPSKGTDPGGVRLVRYDCSAVGEDNWLWRSSQTVSEYRADREPVVEYLMPGCRNLDTQFAYLPDAEDGPLDWMGQWLIEGVMPRFVSITLFLSDGRFVTRLIANPSGALQSLEAGP